MVYDGISVIVLSILTPTTDWTTKWRRRNLKQNCHQQQRICWLYPCSLSYSSRAFQEKKKKQAVDSMEYNCCCHVFCFCFVCISSRVSSTKQRRRRRKKRDVDDATANGMEKAWRRIWKLCKSNHGSDSIFNWRKMKWSNKKLIIINNNNNGNKNCKLKIVWWYEQHSNQQQ